MYYNFDKTNTFYCYNHKTKEYFLIGTKTELLEYLSRFFKDTEYKDTSRWDWEILYNQNLTMNDTVLMGESLYLREITFYDGENRIIDIRDYLQEVIQYYKSYKPKNYFSYVYRGKSRRQWRKFHSGNHSRHIMPKTIRILRMDAPIEMKCFKRGTKKELPRYWDDKGRRVSSCWKDQKKYKKQWMHKIKANNADSIRYYEEV